MTYVRYSANTHIYNWKGVEILIVQMNDGANASPHYRVLGEVEKRSENEGEYFVTPITKKEQRSCRAFLRGHKYSASGRRNRQAIPYPRAKISFLEK